MLSRCRSFLAAVAVLVALAQIGSAQSLLPGASTIGCSHQPALTGDVTTSAGACATAIGSAKVTDAMLANNYSGIGSCTNQFVRGVNDNAAPTCATVSLANDVTGTLGTSSTPILANANTADVTANAADTYLTGSNVTIGARQKAGTVIRWRFAMTKTAAGTATPVFSVRLGTNGSTADTARLTYTGVAQTAATDTGFVDVSVIVRSISATGTVQGALIFQHAGTTTGFANAAQPQPFQSVSGTFDNTAAGTIIGVSCNPGASGVWTFQLVHVEASNLT